MHIDANFDSGNIDVVSQNDRGEFALRIRKDAGEQHLQWFHFRLDGARNQSCVLQIVNAGETSYPHAWKGYNVCTSSDRETWERVETEYEDGVLTVHHQPEADMQWYAYFAPHSHEQHLDLLTSAQLSGLAEVDRIGSTVEGRDLHRITAGSGPLHYWLIGRQHPGESMASWWMEGFLARLLNPADALARKLRETATISVIPHMNPDGAILGHLRTNAAGANLNREWEKPTLEKSPEVLHTRNAMDETGMDFCLDVHGDEALPYVFLSGAEGTAGFEEGPLPALCDLFSRAYERANPDLQRVHGYPVSAPGTANMTMCTNALSLRFQCPAYTLEMPFKDNANAPDPEVGWSPDRSAELGASAIDALFALARAQSPSDSDQ